MKVGVVIPCYRVKEKILSVLVTIQPEIEKIYVVDDRCPEHSGEFVLKNCSDPRVCVIHHVDNQGVGGAVMSGYRRAMTDGLDIIVKIDGDGQMDPALIAKFVNPIASREFDYTKGNRFYRIDDVKHMPAMRLFGNAVLSFFSKVSTGYWNIFDPTNGYTAISTECLKNIELAKVNRRYFFESDLLFRLALAGANVKDVPMTAVYLDEKSSLEIKRIILPFLRGHLSNFFRRIVYDYILRDFSMASVCLFLGLMLLIFGTSYGFYHWNWAVTHNTTATSGQVMIAALPIIVGIQLILSFLNSDISKGTHRARATYPWDAGDRKRLW